jgi:hypothetical protein
MNLAPAVTNSVHFEPSDAPKPLSSVVEYIVSRHIPRTRPSGTIELSSWPNTGLLSV